MTDRYQWRGLIKAVAAVRYPFFFNLFILILWIIVLYYSRGPRIMIRIYILYIVLWNAYYIVMFWAMALRICFRQWLQPLFLIKLNFLKFFIYLHFYKVNKSNYYCVWSRFKIYIKVRKIFLMYIKFNR